MANFELQLKTVEIMGWLMASETPEEQSAKIGNFLSGMGFEYNRFGSMLTVGPLEHAADKKDVCIRAFYHPTTGHAAKPEFHAGAVRGPYIRETLEMSVRLAVFSLLRNIITDDNVFLCISTEEDDIPAIYSFDRFLETYGNESLSERQDAFGIPVVVSADAGSIVTAGINDYIDRTLLSVIGEECGDKKF